MPVACKGRSTIAMTMAAMFLAAASSAACAQSQSQGPAVPDEDIGLRGTEPPLAQSQAGQILTPAGAGAAPLGTAVQTGAGPTAQPGTSPENETTTSANYGRPKSKKPVLYQLPRVPPPKPPFGYPPLPPLTTYKTAPGTIRKGGAPPPTDELPPPPAPTVAVIPMLPHPVPPKREEKSYDPTGVDVGSLRLFPYAEVDSGYDSNPNLLPQGVVGSAYLHGETGGKLQSQWSQNSLGGQLRAGYYDYFEVPLANRPDIAANLVGRVDVTRDTKINLESRFAFTTAQPGSPLIAIPGAIFITSRPVILNYGQTLGMSQQINRLTLDLRGTFDRAQFGDATQSDGTELLLSEDDFNAYGITGKASYELSPLLIPYLQVTGDARRYDNYFDVFGFARNSDGIDVRGGAKFEITRLLTGDLSAGYAERHYFDPRLPLLATPTLNGSLSYTPTPLTTLTLTAVTTLSETTLPNASGAASHRITAQVQHALLRNLTLSATGTYQINQYPGTPTVEHFWSAGVGIDYNVTRDLLLRGSYTHASQTSNLLGDFYTDDVFLVGLKWQR